jgi:hypothetical protein
MKKLFFSFLIVLCSGFNAFNQIQWERLFSKESTDAFRCVREVTSGGGFVLAGYTADSTVNDTDAFVVRLNASGDTIWTFTYNGTLSGKDLFYKIINTTDGGFVAVGYTSSVTGTSDDLLYIKLNSQGQIEWTKTFGDSGRERCQDIVETVDGYTIVGYTNSSPAQYYDALVLHINFSGNTLWSKIIGDAGYDDANAVELLPDGGYIAGGQSNNGSNGLDKFLIRFNSAGDTLWTKRFGGPGTENIESLTLVADGFVFAGSINPTGSDDNGYLVKTDTSGNLIWTKIYGGSEQDDFHTVEKTNDGGFVLCGTTSSSGALNPNIWLFKTNSLGDSSWAATFGGDNHDHGYSTLQTSDGGYIVAGYSSSFGFNNEEGYVVKTGTTPTGNGQLSYISVFNPATQICKSTTLKLKFIVRNFGNTSKSNIPLTVQLTGAVNQTLNASYTGPLNPHDLDTISISQTINTSAGGVLNIYAYTGIVNTVYPENNSLTLSINLLPCVSIEDVENKLGYEFYPNPANEKVVIDFSDNYRKANFEIISNTGATVLNFSATETSKLKKEIDLSFLAPGLYFIKLSTENGTDVRKLVVE